MKVSNLLNREMILSDLKSRERDAVLQEMVGFLKQNERIGKEKELIEKLHQREELGSTAIGDGVAIPHCKVDSIREPLILLAISREGVDFRAPDGSLSRVFFLVVSPSESPSLNLQVLAAVAHLVRKADKMFERMLAAEDAVSIMKVLKEEEDRINE